RGARRRASWNPRRRCAPCRARCRCGGGGLARLLFGLGRRRGGRAPAAELDFEAHPLLEIVGEIAAGRKVPPVDEDRRRAREVDGFPLLAIARNQIRDGLAVAILTKAREVE